MAMQFAVPGERVRVLGTVHSELDDSDQPQFEVRANEVVLLRPRIRPVIEASVGGGAPSTATTTSAKPPKQKYRPLPPRAAAVAAMKTLTDEQRKEKAVDAAAEGDVARLDALAVLNFNLSAPVDSYGQTAILIASHYGHTLAVRALLRHKADPNIASHGGVTPASAAAAGGHGEVLSILAEAGANLDARGSEGLAPIEYVMRRAGCCGSVDGHAAGADPARLVRLIPNDAEHPGAGSCYIDGGVPEESLRALDELFERLPIHPRGRCSQGMSDRSYFCDAEGWVSKLLDAACVAGAKSRASGMAAAEEEVAAEAACAAAGIKRTGVGTPNPLPCAGEAVREMRYLIYAEAGGGLPPHTDLSRTRRDGVTSKCTFLLYLKDCDVGGHTVLLDKLPHESINGSTNVLAAVTPKRGRLLLFPHACPHRADAVVQEGLPKILLRGEIV